MSNKAQNLSERLSQAFSNQLTSNTVSFGEVTIELKPQHLIEVCVALRDREEFSFEQLIDVCGVDYSAYGVTEWTTNESSSTGFSRGIQDSATHGRLQFGDESKSTESQRPRFASVYHLLSYKHNERLRIRVYAEDDMLPVVPSVVSVWSSADWYERESFDLYGIFYDGHSDLRRILTDYGFVGHPFRKDFPLIGNVEMRYDPEQRRVVYQPVTIEPRVLVPRVIRKDNRYIHPQEENSSDA